MEVGNHMRFGIGASDPLNSNVYSFINVWSMPFHTINGNQLELTVHIEMAFKKIPINLYLFLSYGSTFIKRRSCCVAKKIEKRPFSGIFNS